MLEKHSILSEFPEQRDRIVSKISGDAAFAKLVNDYSRLDSEVYALEASGTPVTDTVIEDLKKRRLRLKDSIYQAL